VCEADHVGVAAQPHGVVAVDRVGVVDHVAGAHVAEEDDRRERAVEELLVQLVLALDDLDLGGTQRVDGLPGADDADVVDDEALVGRLEVEPELRDLLDGGGCTVKLGLAVAAAGHARATSSAAHRARRRRGGKRRVIFL